MSPHDGGVPPAKVPRLSQVDVLRGFALLGVCMVNAPVLAGAWTLPEGPDAAAWDRTAAWMVTALFTTKFYLLFAFLFGYSFVFQEASAARDGVPFARRHARRLLGLFLLGLAHAVLLYPGDILMTYAALGLLLYLLRGLDTRALLWTAGALVALLTAVFAVIGVVALGLDDVGQVSDGVLQARQTAWYRGDFGTIVHANIAAYRHAFTGALLYGPHLLAAMLTGLAAGRRGWLDPERSTADSPPARAPARRRPPDRSVRRSSDGDVQPRTVRRVLLYLGQAVDVLTAPVLSAAYAAVLLSLLRGRHAAALAPASRMTLSHYLLQSAVLAFVFTGYGLACYGTVGPAALACGCAVLWAAQLALSAGPLAHVRHGPAEVLLRRITGGRPPARRSARRRTGG
ncbi:DUF418 domain-containing protein [Streptomyces sp. NPDC090106]|uniref:DUF418 domain-containing protein n=1 Tax=Streptomyces sp. NPDC090106 TaxID=3365946 RepID=UPI00382430DF